MAGDAYLLDTHAAIWWWINDGRLGRRAAGIIAAGDARIYVSAASVWEIAIKTRAGRLREIKDFAGQYAPLMDRHGFARLPVTDEHALLAGMMDAEHADPFDRLLAAQAQIENLPLMTRDPQMAKLGCQVLW